MGHILLIGFRNDLDDMINEIDKWVAPGSVVYLFNDTPIDKRMEILMSGGLAETFNNIALEHFEGNPIFYKDVVKVAPQTKTATIILTEKVEDRDGLSSDSRTLVTSLLVRHLQKLEHGRHAMASTCKLVCEIMDPRTENLLSMAGPTTLSVPTTLSRWHSGRSLRRQGCIRLCTISSLPKALKCISNQFTYTPNTGPLCPSGSWWPRRVLVRRYVWDTTSRDPPLLSG